MGGGGRRRGAGQKGRPCGRQDGHSAGSLDEAPRRETHLGSLHGALDDRLVEQTASGLGQRGVVDGAGAGAGGRGRRLRVALFGSAPRRCSLGLWRGRLLGGDRLAGLAAELPAGAARPERRPRGLILQLQRRERLSLLRQLAPSARGTAHCCDQRTRASKSGGREREVWLEPEVRSARRRFSYQRHQTRKRNAECVSEAGSASSCGAVTWVRPPRRAAAGAT